AASAGGVSSGRRRGSPGSSSAGDRLMTGPPRDFLFVQSATEMGGPEIVLLTLFECSPELRRRSVVANLSFGSGNFPARLRAADVEVVDLPKARVRDLVGVGRTLAALRGLI